MPVLNSRLFRLTVASLVAGALIGVVGGLFERLLVLANWLRDGVVALAHGWHYIGWIVPLVLVALGAALARIMVLRISPEAAGSGVQRVEAVFAGEVQPASSAILPVKFFGGLLALGSGLALGREGPMAQMGASVASLISRFFVLHDEDAKVIDAAGAGAGIAVAFNAPIGGSIFVFEELTSSFTPWLLVATLAAALTAVWVMRLIMGNHFDFSVPQLSIISVWRWWLFIVLGALLGAVGAAYNRIIVRLLRLTDHRGLLNSVQWALLIGGTVGLVAWFAPALVGGGDNLTQSVLSGRFGIGMLAIVFGLRFFLGPWSYAAGTPGGLFAPMLVLGASFGALFGQVLHHFSPGLGVSPVACAVVGMGTLFSACVRAPLTGIMLTVEMTGRGDLTLGLLGGSLAAMVVAMLLDSEPIYETLKRQMLERQRLTEAAAEKLKKPEPASS
jgi:chloride channel protein, CIC family